MSSNHSSSSPSPNSITTIYYLNQQQQRAPSSHNVNFRQPTVVNFHNPPVDSSQQMYHYRIEDSTSSQSPQQLKERAQSPLIVAVPNQRQQQRASSVLSGKSSPALSQVSQQDQSSTSPTEQEILKCAHFFKSLLKMRPQQQQIINILDLKNLLREVLLGEQTPEEFTVKLREVTKSQDKGNLLPFLKRALPALRRSIQNGEYFELRQALDLDDYSPKSSLPTPPPNESQQNVLPSSPMMPNAPAAQQQIVFIEQQSKIIQQQKVVSADCLEQKITTTTTTVVEEQTAHSQIKQECSNTSSILHFQQAAEPKTPTALAIESETGPTLAPNTIPNNIINLPQMLLNPQALADRILAHMPSAEGVDPEVLAIISNATEARLRTILTHLSMLAEHRMEQLRIDPHYRMIDEPRKQLRFMEDIEKRAHDNRQNAEKEALLKITKSKGKDKDTLEKAKQLQKADREATVNREANAAAFAALGRIGTKRPFTANAGTADWKSGLQTQGLGNGLTGPARPSRIKRVTIRDLQFFLSVSAASPSNAKLRHRLALSGLNIDENTSI